MFWIDLVFALAVGLLMTIVFLVALRKDGPWISLPIVFLVVGLAAWAGGRWLGPLGPALLDVYWVPFLLGGAAGALLVTIAIRASSGRSDESELDARRPAEAAVGMFLWLVIMVLLLAVVVAYL